MIKERSRSEEGARKKWKQRRKRGKIAKWRWNEKQMKTGGQEEDKAERGGRKREAVEEESQTEAQPVTSNPQGDRLLIWSGGVSHRLLSVSLF